MRLTDEMRAMRESGASYEKIAQRVGVAKSTVQGAFGVRKRRGKAPTADSSPSPNQALRDTLSLSDVLAGYDSVGKVLELVREIPTGRLRKDESLRAELGIGEKKWSAVRNSIRVSGYVYQLPNKEYVWGSKATIAGIPAKLRELLA